MFLKSLTIESEGQIVRDIVFHKGMNFIVDNTKSTESSNISTGNNIGKTTVLRLINFCLGGSDKSIYQSKEFKNNINEEVKRFLIDTEVVITLKLRDNLDDLTSRQVEIRRNFLSGAKKILEVNGQSVKVKDLDTELKKQVFNYEEKKPTFKQLKAKYIRDDAERLENTVKVLGNFGRLEEYEALYLFWLGVQYPDADKKRKLLEERNLEDKLYTRLTRENSESKLIQFLKIIEKDIEKLEHQKSSFNINENYENDLGSLNIARSNLNLLYSEQSNLELRKDLIEESKVELEKSMSDVQTSLLSELYTHANALIPNLQKSYEDTVVFHNQMVQEKISFVTEELPTIEKRLTQINSEIQQNLNKEKLYVEKLQKSDAVDELQVIITKLNEKHEQKGRLEEKYALIQNSKENLSNIDENLSEIDSSIHALDNKIQDRVASFNEYFSEISNNLYGEKFAMSASFEPKKNTEQRFYRLYIDSLDGQTGTGKKKGEIAAFDIAYVKFADKLNLNCLHFILHDQMEVVDDNQIVGLVGEVVKANCQFVVPILRDKLPAELDKPEYQALTLSQEDKLFKL